MDNHEILLQQCAQNLIDEVTFKRFLETYMNFWSRCRRGRIHPPQLNQAMKNVHRYAQKKGESLTFNEGGYEMVNYSVPCGLDQKKDTLTGSNRSHYAPDYSELVHLLKHSLAMFDRFAARAGDEAGKSEEMQYLAARIRKHLTGAERMIQARDALQERYDPFKTEPQRDREIDELLRFYRHLWNFAEETEGKDREKADYLIVCTIGEIVPPFSEHGITEDKIGEYLHEKADWLEQNNIISFKKRDEVAKETLIHYLHDPDKWCREKPVDFGNPGVTVLLNPNHETIMCHSEETFEGFVVRCYSDDLDKRDYAGIICDVCDSVEDVADAILEHLAERVQDDAGGNALSEAVWNRVREQIVEEANRPVWEFKPWFFEELRNTNAPDSIKVNQVRLSRRLVERIRNGK